MTENSAYGPLVLVIDDDEITLLLATEALEAEGFRILTAANGKQGLALFTDRHPDCVLLDLNMPEMSGFDCCIRMRQIPGAEQIPIVVFTSADDGTAVAQALQVGAEDFVTKPVHWPLLGHRLRNLLRTSLIAHSLARNAASLAQAQALAHIGNWEWQLDGQQGFWSQELFRILDLAPKHIHPSFSSFLQTVPLNDSREVLRAFAYLHIHGTPFSLEHQVLQRDGRELTVLHQAGAVTDEKGHPRLLHGTVQDITERKQHEAHLKYLCTHDALTGLPTRGLLIDRLQQAIAYGKRNQHRLAVVFIDLDHFKLINDSLGHHAGDELLKAVAGRLLECIRESDTAARLSGDEFALALSLQDSDDILFQTVHRLLSSIAQPLLIHDHEVSVTSSIGISVYPQDGEKADGLLKCADIAMYRAKSGGRNSFQFFTPDMTESIKRRVEMERDLRRALAQQEFSLHYQPQVDLHTGKVFGVETLLRWSHPEHGMIPPGDFISLAEETGLIVQIGEWVLRTACIQGMAWEKMGFQALQIAVNLSARQFRHPDLVAMVARSLKQSGLPPHHLELELTESVSMEQPERSIDVLERLNKLGVKLSIDDFGTGYSNLNYLKIFPVDKLKLDQSFVRDVTHDPNDLAISRAVIALAHSLNLRVIAEGVETRGQLALLRSSGADEIQGYYFSRPLDSAACTAFLKTGHDLPLDEFSDEEPAVLLIDDDAEELAALKRALDGRVPLHTAGNAREAFEILAQHDVKMVLCDQGMPEMSGLAFFNIIKRMYPCTIRILLCDQIQPCNQSHIDQDELLRCINKPWDNASLMQTIDDTFAPFQQASQ